MRNKRNELKGNYNKLNKKNGRVIVGKGIDTGKKR